MEKKKGARGRGRPRKNPIKSVENGPKRKRGRPSKTLKVKGSENIIVSTPEIEEIYVEPKLLRKKRVFRFDRSLFHTFAHRFNGDIIKMSYIINELMKLYMEKKIKIDWKLVSSQYYDAWSKGSPLLEPLVLNELAQAHAVSHGIPLQYKYSIVIDENVFTAFENKAEKYPPFIINKLLQLYMDEKNKVFMDKHIKEDKTEGWCNF